MSYHGVHESSRVDYMVCSGCDDAAFTWMAQIFSCPNCGGTEYVDPVSNKSRVEELADENANGDGEDEQRGKASRIIK
jgi:predicted RNA-binding Zn-ribbon protein involved in translation (DUF1610 family)